MLEYLNALPGPPLTLTDVKQRLRALWEEPSDHYPDEDLKEGCPALYYAEKMQGTELIAIVGAIREYSPILTTCSKWQASSLTPPRVEILS